MHYERLYSVAKKVLVSALCCGYGKGNRYEIECVYEIGIRLITVRRGAQSSGSLWRTGVRDPVLEGVDLLHS